MFRLKSRLSVIQPTESILVLRSSPGRRIMFGLIGAILLIAFFSAVDWQIDFQRGSIAGTMVFLALTAICAAVAAWGRTVQFDSSRGEISFIKRVFGIQVARNSVATTDVRGVTIQGIRFLKDSERPQAGLMNSRFRNYVDRRNTYFKLYLDLGDRMHLLEDSTDMADLDAAATVIAGFLKVTLRREDL